MKKTYRTINGKPGLVLKKFSVMTTVMIVALFMAKTAPAKTATSAGGAIQANVTANCQISSAGNLLFGNYDPTSSTDTTAQGSAVVRCTRTVSYKTYITGTRSFTYSGNTLNFSVWRDVGHTQTFESNNTGASTISGSNAGVTIDYYGLMTAGQDVQESGGQVAANLSFIVEF